MANTQQVKVRPGKRRPDGTPRRLQLKAAVAEVKPKESSLGFNFRAMTKDGARADYYVPIGGEGEARAALREAGLKVERLTPRRGVRRKRARIPKNIEMALIAEQFGDLWEAAEPPGRILRTVGDSTPNPLVAAAFKNAADDVRNGAALSDALAAQTTVTAMPDIRKREAALAAGKVGRPVFPTTFTHAIRIAEEVGAITDPTTGEKRGAMGLMMERFAVDQTRMDSLKSAVRGALAYPAAVLVVAVGVIAVMLYVAMPKLKQMYVEMTNGGELPLPTRILIAVSDWCVSPLGIALGLLAVGGAAGFAYWCCRTKRGQEWLDRRVLWLPYFGEMIRWYHMANLARVFGMLMSGGAGVNYALRETAAAMTNCVYREMVLNVLGEFERESRPLFVLFRPYTPLVTESFHTQLVTYEDSGGMDKKMARLSRVCDTRCERRVGTIKHVLNTYIIIPIGVFALVVTVALYSPMFDLVGKMASAGH